jgi:hypothetical protein
MGWSKQRAERNKVWQQSEIHMHPRKDESQGKMQSEDQRSLERAGLGVL